VLKEGEDDSSDIEIDPDELDCWDWGRCLEIGSILLLWYGYPRILSGCSMKCVRAQISHPGTSRMASGEH
jgi:hypothetical protein